MSNCAAAFSVRFVKNGDVIQVTTNIANEDGEGKALFQVIDPISGTVAPSWKEVKEQPIISFQAKSTVGYPVKITGIGWGYNGKTLSFDVLSGAWQDEKTGLPFKARMSSGMPQLRVTDNIAGTSVMANRQISYEIEYVSNGMTDKVQGSMDVIIQASGDNSYNMQIVTGRGIELSEALPSITLSVQAYYGTNKLLFNDGTYTVEWYQGETALNKSGTSLEVTRDMVEGGSVFVAKLLKGGSVVAQDGQRVVDIADEYQIHCIPTGVNYVTLGRDAEYSLQVLRNKKPIVGQVTFDWSIHNVKGEVTHRKDSADVKPGIVTIKPEYCIYQSGDNEDYGDVDVYVTATLN